MLDRRRFLKLLGLSSLSLGLSPLLESCHKISTPRKLEPSTGLDFHPLGPSIKDELILPQGFHYRIIRSWGDSIGKGQYFGFNNDFTCFLPLENPNEALLWVNHESVDPHYIPDIAEQRKSVGGSIIRIKRNADADWVYDYSNEHSHNRRIDANTPVEFTGPLQNYFHEDVYGTLANCGGTRTPWGSVLTCEENYEDFDSKYHWPHFKKKHYGWIVEINPYDPRSTPRKHSWLGRFAHENATIRISKSGKVVVYMGDDKENEYIYKFISSHSFQQAHSTVKAYEYRDIFRGFSDLLSEGRLFVARFHRDGETISPSLDPQEQGQGEWLELSRQNPKLAKRYKSDAEMLIHTREAARLLGASPLDRPEDLEVSPHDGSVYISLTKNLSRLNDLGSILRLIEEDPEAKDFQYKNFVIGSSEQGFSCPDNLAFDTQGNLWVTTDATVEFMLPERRKNYGNNGLYVIALSGPQAAIPRRFASAPLGAELTGPYFSDDGETLFLSVQHPSGRWPHTGTQPKAAVLSINLSKHNQP